MQPRRIFVCLFILLLCSSCSLGNVQQTPKSDLNRPQAQTKAHKVSSTPDLAGGKEKNVREPHPMSLADLRKKYSGAFLLNGAPTKREVALTFDDAPDAEFTPKVLDVLKKEKVKATFFVVGNRVKAHPEIAKRIVQEGHIIGNHTYSHANLPKLTDREFRDQIVKTDKLIKPLSGYTPKIVRPPYGNVSEDQIRWLASKGKKIVNWNVDSLDWKGLNAEQVQTNVLAQVRPGSIILQHAAGGEGEDLTGTVNALPTIIHKLRNDGVKLVTVTDLLDIPTE